MTTLPATYACHCAYCQTWSGSAFALHALLPALLVKIRGETSEYAYADESGVMSRHWSCPTCATRIANENDGVPSRVILRAGTLDRSSELTPVAHIWTSRKQAWEQIAPDVGAFDTSPTPQEFGAALAKAAMPSCGTTATAVSTLRQITSAIAVRLTKSGPAPIGQTRT